MKKRKIIFIIISSVLALVLLLAGCQEQELDRAALGWAEDWTAVDDLLAAEPLEGFTASENLDAMSASGLWYATWTSGEAEVTESEDGTRAELYPAEIYLLIEECKSPAQARAELTVWSARERDSYDCGEAAEAEYAGQSFSVIPLLAPLSEDNPYSRGVTALGVRGSFAISVELLCREDFDGDPEAVLSDFLSGLHYNDKEA